MQKSNIGKWRQCAEHCFLYTINQKDWNMTATICSGISFPTSHGAGNITLQEPLILPLCSNGWSYWWVAGTNLATNPTNVVQTATYTVIPSANGCAGLPFCRCIRKSKT
jgi:hypothetical protein